MNKKTKIKQGIAYISTGISIVCLPLITLILNLEKWIIPTIVENKLLYFMGIAYLWWFFGAVIIIEGLLNIFSILFEMLKDNKKIYKRKEIYNGK